MEREQPNSIGKCISTKRKACKAPYPKSKPIHKSRHHSSVPNTLPDVQTLPCTSLLEHRLQEANHTLYTPCTPCSTRLNYLDKILRRSIPSPFYAAPHMRDYDHIMGRFAAHERSGERPSYLSNIHERTLWPDPTASSTVNNYYSLGRNLPSTHHHLNPQMGGLQVVDYNGGYFFNSSRLRDCRNVCSSYNYRWYGCSPLGVVYPTALVARELEQDTNLGNCRIKDYKPKQLILRGASLSASPNLSESLNLSPSEINNNNMENFRSAFLCAAQDQNEKMHTSETQTGLNDTADNVDIQDEIYNTIAEDIDTHIEDVQSTENNLRDVITLLTENDLSKISTAEDKSKGSVDYVKDTLNEELSAELEGKMGVSPKQEDGRRYEDSLDTDQINNSRDYVKYVLNINLDKVIQSNISSADKFEDALDEATPKTVNTMRREENNTKETNESSDHMQEFEEITVNAESADLLVDLTTKLLEEINKAVQN